MVVQSPKWVEIAKHLSQMTGIWSPLIAWMLYSYSRTIIKEN